MEQQACGDGEIIAPGVSNVYICSNRGKEYVLTESERNDMSVKYREIVPEYDNLCMEFEKAKKRAT